MDLLPDERKQKVFRYYRETDKVLSAVTYLLFRKGIAEEYGISDELYWDSGRYGKPYLPDNPGSFFSISHCDCCAVCVVSDSEVGVDVQDDRGISADLAEMMCSKSELSLINDSIGKEPIIRRIWTLKEAYLKYLGVGLDHDLKKLDFSDVEAERFRKYDSCFTYAEKGKYSLAVCGEKYFSSDDFCIIKAEDLMYL